MTENELLDITKGYYALLERQGELFDNIEALPPSLIGRFIHDVVKGASATVKLRLSQEAYREKWSYKNTLRTDKWTQRDLVREQRRARRLQLQAAKEAYKAAREGECCRKKGSCLQTNSVRYYPTPLANIPPPPEGRYPSAETKCRQEK